MNGALRGALPTDWDGDRVTGRHAGPPVTLDDADRGVLTEFVEQDAPSRVPPVRTRRTRGRSPLTDEERAALPPLSFEDATLGVLIDVNKGFPEPPLRRTYGVLRNCRCSAADRDEAMTPPPCRSARQQRSVRRRR